MRAVAAIALAAVVLVMAGWSGGGSEVRHAAVRLAHPGPGGLPLVVEVWHETSTGEFTVRLRGDSDVELLRGRTIYSVTDGRVFDVTTYSKLGDAWRVVHERYGLTAKRANAALAAGRAVARPKLMTVPKPDPDEYTVTRDFGTNVAALRHAAGFAVPSPGPRLDGRALADVSLSRTRTSNGDSGDVGFIGYSSKPGGDTEVTLDVAPPASGWGASYATFFAKSRKRIAGYDARLTSDGDAILRYHGSYVLVRLDEQGTASRWRAVVGQIARS